MIPRRALLAAVLATPARAEAAWRIVTEYPATAMPGEGIATFAAAAAGALSIVPSYDAPGGLRSAEMVAAVASGQPEAADAFTGALAAQAAVYQLSALPFLTASFGDAARLLQAARPLYAAALAGQGVTLLYATPWPLTGLWSRVPIPDSAALRTLRIRTYDGAGTAVLRAAGADAVQLSFADALPRLRAGALDAVLSSGDGGAGARLWELLPVFTPLEYACPLSLAFCNTAALTALRPAQQNAVREAAVQTEARQFVAIRTRTDENTRRLAANGVTIAPAAGLRAALVPHAGPVIAEWATRAGPDAAAALRLYRG